MAGTLLNWGNSIRLMVRRPVRLIHFVREFFERLFTGNSGIKKAADLKQYTRRRLFLLIFMGMSFLVSMKAQAEVRGGIDQPAEPLQFSEVLNDNSNSSITLESLKGNVVVLEFWATWCGPCIQRIPHLNDLAGQFKDQQVRFVAITDEDRNQVTKFLSSHKVDVPVALDSDQLTFKAYGVRSRPLAVLIDKEGIVAGAISASWVTAGMIRQLLDGKKLTIGDNRNLEASLLGNTNETTETQSLFRLDFRVSQTDRAINSSGRGGTQVMKGWTLQQLLGIAHGVPADNVVASGMEFPATRFDLNMAGRDRKTSSFATGMGYWFSPIVREILLDTFQVEAMLDETQTSAGKSLLIVKPTGKTAKQGNALVAPVRNR